MDRRSLIYKKTNGQCAHCGKLITRKGFTDDHFIPKSWGGEMNIKNLFPLCAVCNKERGNQIVEAKSFYPFAKEFAIYEANLYYLQWKIKYGTAFQDISTIINTNLLCI